MIVDIHTHVWENEHISEKFVADARITSGNPNFEIAVDLDKHWAVMEAVDKAVVLGFRARHVGVLVPNEYVADYVDRHPEKLIGFCSIDPIDPDAVEQLDYCVKNLGFRGLKLAPIYQNVAPGDSRMRRLFARAEQLEIPVLIHQGTTFCENVSIEIANPVLLQPIALEFPRLRMVIAHMGHPWINEAVVLIRKNRNLVADISALYYRPWQFYNALVTAMEYGVLDRLLFGTDYPFTTPLATMEALRKVNEIVSGTNLPRIPEARIEEIIQSDGLGMLGLD